MGPNMPGKNRVVLLPSQLTIPRNITLSEVNQCVLYAVLTANISLTSDQLSAATVLPTVLKNISTLQQLLTKYSR